MLRPLARLLDLSFGRLRLARAARRHPIRLIIGASGTNQRGWIASDRAYLDLLKPEQWTRYFEPSSITAVLAEHVWEHLTPEDGRAAAMTIRRFLRPGGHLRWAVPDGLHPDPEYVNWVRPNGTGPGADDHKVLYTYESAKNLFSSVGFQVELLEFWDETGTFHGHPWNPTDGYVKRTAKNDPRNQDGTLRYTSLLLDARV
jgi:predicted SAM-dependent methyltransferase